MKGKLWKQAAVGIFAGMLVMQAAGISANAKLVETLTQAGGQFIRANGSVVEGALAKGITISKYQNRAGAIDWGRDYPVSYPVAYDVESQSLLDMGKTRQEITDQVNAFCQVIEAAGYRPIVYGSHEWLSRHMDTAQIPYDIWYARYETSVNDYPNRTLWQYTENGLVDGISGEVCIDIAFLDYSQIIPAAGWRMIGGKWYYYQDYQKQTGWDLQGDDGGWQP